MTKISSGLKLLFLVHFVFGLVFGLLYLFIPVMFQGWFGVTVADALPYRIIGVAVLAFSASSWYCYMTTEESMRQYKSRTLDLTSLNDYTAIQRSLIHPKTDLFE